MDGRAEKGSVGLPSTFILFGSRALRARWEWRDYPNMGEEGVREGVTNLMG
jgi:hypothetical protein